MINPTIFAALYYLKARKGYLEYVALLNKESKSRDIALEVTTVTISISPGLSNNCSGVAVYRALCTSNWFVVPF